MEDKMKKSELISKYEHQLTLKNYSENTLKAYLNGLNIFLQYLSLKRRGYFGQTMPPVSEQSMPLSMGRFALL